MENLVERKTPLNHDRLRIYRIIYVYDFYLFQLNTY